jgi:hypothetical protein
MNPRAYPAAGALHELFAELRGVFAQPWSASAVAMLCSDLVLLFG